MLVAFVGWLLRHKRLSADSRATLLNYVLTTVGALPLHGIITTDDAGRLHIRGKAVEYDQAVLLRESALNVLRSPAYQIIREQVLAVAVHKGIHEALTTDQMWFAKAAIWYGVQELDLLNTLAGDAGNSPLSGD